MVIHNTHHRPQPTHHKPQLATTGHKPHVDLTHKTQQIDLNPQPTPQHANLKEKKTKRKKNKGRRVQARLAVSGGRDGQSWVGMVEEERNLRKKKSKVEEVRTEFCNENKREKEKKNDLNNLYHCEHTIFFFFNL